MAEHNGERGVWAKMSWETDGIDLKWVSESPEGADVFLPFDWSPSDAWEWYYGDSIGERA